MRRPSPAAIMTAFLRKEKSERKNKQVAGSGTPIAIASNPTESMASRSLGSGLTSPAKSPPAPPSHEFAAAAAASGAGAAGCVAEGERRGFVRLEVVDFHGCAHLAGDPMPALGAPHSPPASMHASPVPSPRRSCELDVTCCAFQRPPLAAASSPVLLPRRLLLVLLVLVTRPHHTLSSSRPSPCLPCLPCLQARARASKW